MSSKKTGGKEDDSDDDSNMLNVVEGSLTAGLDASVLTNRTKSKFNTTSPHTTIHDLFRILFPGQSLLKSPDHLLAAEVQCK